MTSVTFASGAGTVTGANFLFEHEETKILIDCGLLQEGRTGSLKNYEPFPYDPAAIDALVVTHSHADHIGRIPKLVREGFAGMIYSTAPTRELAEIMLEDSLRHLTHEAEMLRRPPLYEAKDIAAALALWRTMEYHETQEIGLVSFRFFDAGHILGSAMAEFSYAVGTDKKKLLVTGDLGNQHEALLPDTEHPQHIDYLVMESVYGDRTHDDSSTRTQKLRAAIEEAIDRNGTLMIPVFAIERTQMILYELNNLIESGLVPSIPVYLDSPLAIRTSEVYTRHKSLLREEVREQIRGGDDVFSFPSLKLTARPDESRRIWTVGGAKIILAGSGMSHGGRILEHERHYLENAENILLFVGYQSVGTVGRLLQDGARNVEINGTRVKVRAAIRTIGGYSGHADRDGLLDFVEPLAPELKKVCVVMGEPRSSLFLVQRLRDYLGVSAVAPEAGETVELK